MAEVDYLQNYVQDTSARDRDPSTPTLPNKDETLKALIKGTTRELKSRIETALKESETGFHEKNPDYQPIDLGHVANEVWEILNQMDDSPFGQMMNGVVYGAAETASQIISSTYNVLASRYGEQLTTTINDPDSYQALISPIVEQLQSEIEVPVDMSNSSREAANVTEQVVDYLAQYLDQSSPSAEPELEHTQTRQEPEIER